MYGTSSRSLAEKATQNSFYIKTQSKNDWALRMHAKSLSTLRVTNMHIEVHKIAAILWFQIQKAQMSLKVWPANKKKRKKTRTTLRKHCPPVKEDKVNAGPELSSIKLYCRSKQGQCWFTNALQNSIIQKNTRTMLVQNCLSAFHISRNKQRKIVPHCLPEFHNGRSTQGQCCFVLSLFSACKLCL